MQKKTTRPAVILLTSLLSLSSALLLSLSGCGGGGGGGSNPPPPPGTSLARFAYVTNQDDSTVSVFIADNTSGQLRHHGYVQTGSGPTSLTIDPSGQFAYTTNNGGSDISLFTIDSLSGELTSAICDTGTSSLNCGSGSGVPTSMVFEPNGLHAYVANNSTSVISTFDKDPSTGALTANPTQFLVSTDGANPLKLMIDPNGSFLYATYQGDGGVGVYAISATDGTIQAVAGSPVASGGTAAVDIAITPDGQYAYVANSTGEIGAFTIDASGVLVANGSTLSVAGTTPQALAVDSSGQWLYMLSKTTPGSISVFQIQSDGTLSQINCGSTQNCATGDLPTSIAIDTTGQFVSVTNGGDDTLSLFSINQTSGQLTALRGLASRYAPSALAYYSDTAAATVTPRFAYVAHESSNNISAFSINASSGALSAVGTPIATGSIPSSVAASPSGRFVYVANSGQYSVSAYTANSASGALTEITGSPFTTQSGPQSVAVDPSGRFLYVANRSSINGSTAFTINASTGALTEMAGSPFATGNGPYAITVDPTGRFAYVANQTSGSVTDTISAYTIDPTTGALSELASSPYTTLKAPSALAVDPTGRFLYAANAALSGGAYHVSAYAIDSTTGGLTELTNSPYSTVSGSPTSVAVDPLGEFFYTSLSTDNIRAYTVNANNGDLGFISSYQLVTGVDPQSIAIDPSGRFVYTANWTSADVSTFSINASSGALTQISGSPFTTGGSGPISITTTGTVQ